MTYASGSITNANPGPLLYAAMETALLAAGFTLDDTVVIGSKTHKILLSPAGSNMYAKDWYLDVTYPTTGTSGGIMMRTFEDFDSATDLAYRGPNFSASVVSYVPDLATWSWAGSTGYALETNWSTSSPSLSLTTSAFTYYFSATVDRAILMVSNANTTILYAGFYEMEEYFEAQAGADAFPLFCGTIGGGSNGFFGYLTRLPFVAEGDLPWDDSNLDVNGSVRTNGRYFSQNFPTTASSTRFWFFTAYPVFLYKISDAPYGNTHIGWLLNVRYTRGNTGSTQVVGDTCNVTTNPALTGGDEYVLTQRNTHVYMFRTM